MWAMAFSQESDAEAHASGTVLFRYRIPYDPFACWRQPVSEGLQEFRFAEGFLAMLCSRRIACHDMAVANQGGGRQESTGHIELEQIVC